MSDYRRAYVPGGTFFLTLVTYDRTPLFTTPERVEQLRAALNCVMQESPFTIPAAVVLPDHIHFLWTLPAGDTDYSRRVGRMKVLFTRSLHHELSPEAGDSRRKHRESDIWQRRFWEHTIADEDDFERHLDYIHYNPVKHKLVPCAHVWPYSSFARWVRAGRYEAEWGCCCGDRRPRPPVNLNHDAGE
jgi:putative transposase